METRPVLVSYAQIDRAVQGDRLRGLTEAREAAEAVTGIPKESAELAAEFRVALQALERSESGHGVLSSPQNQMAAALQSFLAAEALQAGKVVERKDQTLEAKFDRGDWAGWIQSFFSWFRRFRSGAHPLLSPAAKPIEVNRKLRIAVLGDWGTGLYGAPICAHSIEREATSFDVLLHLGDVYYAGTETEERNRFLNLWPKISGAKNFSLNSNHEMYTGGYGYFDVLLADARFKATQASSFFAFQNDDLLFVGLDTAYREHDIADEEFHWLRSTIEGAGPRKVIFFSHHQPFSQLDDQGPLLESKLAEFLSARRVFAWYWGHEHRCVIYDRHQPWGLYGRCIGHSGFPYSRGAVQLLPKSRDQKDCWRVLESKPYAPGGIVLDGPNPYIAENPDFYGPHGYLTLDVDEGRVIESVRDAAGSTLYQNLLT